MEHLNGGPNTITHIRAHCSYCDRLVEQARHDAYVDQRIERRKGMAILPRMIANHTRAAR